jgi:hypothetical protein
VVLDVADLGRARVVEAIAHLQVAGISRDPVTEQEAADDDRADDDEPNTPAGKEPSQSTTSLGRAVPAGQSTLPQRWR